MGLGRRSDRHEETRPIRVEDNEEFNYADYDLSESGDEAQSAEARTSRSRKNKERRTERKLKKLVDGVETMLVDGVCVKNNMGARKHRRLENVRLLLSYTDRDDICLDFSDLVPRTITAFEQLLSEKENMRKWNEFIEKDEEEQREILETGLWISHEDDEQHEWFVVGGKTTPRRKNEDERKHHPAYSARVCFEQLDKKTKKLLAEKHLPWGFVVFVEKQLREFFSADSDGIFVGNYDCSLQRALLHAVAQYLRLSSKSSTDTSSQTRITEVRNGRAFFIPPRTELVPYLSSLRSEPLDYVPWVPEEDLRESSDDSFDQ